MAYAGARGTTATRWPRRLHFTLPPGRAASGHGRAARRMNAEHKGYQLRVADALWAEKDAAISLPSYLEADARPITARASIASISRRARTSARDHQPVGRKADQRQNQGSTAGPACSRPHAPGADQRHLLQGRLADQFDKASTQDEDFHLSAAQTVKAPLMHRTRRVQLLRWRNVSGARDSLQRRRAVDDRAAAQRRRPACRHWSNR